MANIGDIDYIWTRVFVASNITVDVMIFISCVKSIIIMIYTTRSFKFLLDKNNSCTQSVSGDGIICVSSLSTGRWHGADILFPTSTI